MPCLSLDSLRAWMDDSIKPDYNCMLYYDDDDDDDDDDVDEAYLIYLLKYND